MKSKDTHAEALEEIIKHHQVILGVSGVLAVHKEIPIYIDGRLVTDADIVFCSEYGVYGVEYKTTDFPKARRKAERQLKLVDEFFHATKLFYVSGHYKTMPFYRYGSGYGFGKEIKIKLR